jgi:hypothetical protein
LLRQVRAVRFFRTRLVTLLSASAVVLACGEAPATRSEDTSASSPLVGPSPRDWTAHPAVEVVAQTPAMLYAMSDIHGGYDRAVHLLATNGLVHGVPSSPSAARWAGGSAILVVAGDLIDKGPQPVEVVDLLMALQVDAASQGGRVIVTLGNHEAEFLVDPQNSKATAAGDGVDIELQRRGIAPADFASATSTYGAWLRNLPFAVSVGPWFFSHAGATEGLSLAGLESRLEAALAAHPDFNAPDIVGDTSILEARDWFQPASVVSHNAAALGARHIVFGHDPKALGPRGQIAVDPTQVLLRIDCGLSPLVNDSTGKLLRVRRDGVRQVAEELDSSGQATQLFAEPSSASAD